MSNKDIIFGGIFIGIIIFLTAFLIGGRWGETKARDKMELFYAYHLCDSVQSKRISGQGWPTEIVCSNANAYYRFDGYPGEVVMRKYTLDERELVR